MKTTRIACALLLAGSLATIHAQLRSNPYTRQITGDNRAAVTVLNLNQPNLERLVHLHCIPPPGLDRRRGGIPAQDVFLTKAEALEVTGFLLAIPTGKLPADAKVRIEAKQLTAALVTLNGQTRWTLRAGDRTPWAFIGGRTAAEKLAAQITARVRNIKSDDIETAPQPEPPADDDDA